MTPELIAMTLQFIVAEAINSDPAGHAHPDTRRGSACACRVCVAFAEGASVYEIAVCEGVGQDVIEGIVRQHREPKP